MSKLMALISVHGSTQVYQHSITLVTCDGSLRQMAGREGGKEGGGGEGSGRLYNFTGCL